MLRDALVPLEDMREYAAHALAMGEGQTREPYESNVQFRFAVERCLSVVGESLASLRKHDRATAVRITNWHKVVGMRHLFVHSYRNIDNDKTWNTLTNHLPLLLTEVTALIKEGVREHLPDEPL